MILNMFLRLNLFMVTMIMSLTMATTMTTISKDINYYNFSRDSDTGSLKEEKRDRMEVSF